MTINRYNETRDEDELSQEDVAILCADEGLADDVFMSKAEAFAAGVVVWAAQHNNEQKVEVQLRTRARPQDHLSRLRRDASSWLGARQPGCSLQHHRQAGTSP
jgi:hypothetical protein